MYQIDPESLVDAINDIHKQLLEIRNEISYLKGYVTSMNIHPYVPMIRPPYQVGDYPPSPQPGDYNWPNQVWMSTDNHQPKSVPCQTGDSNARS